MRAISLLHYLTLPLSLISDSMSDNKTDQKYYFNDENIASLGNNMKILQKQSFLDST